MPAGQRVRAVDRSLNGAFRFRHQPVADRKGPLLVEAELLGGGVCCRIGIICIPTRQPWTARLGRAAQDVFGRRPGTAHLAHVVQLLADDLFIEVEEMRAFPRLHKGAAEHAMQRCPRDRAAAKSGNHRMHLRRCRHVAQGKIDIVGELPAHADGEALLDHDDVLSAREHPRNDWVGNGRNDTRVTRPMRNPSARISSIVSLMVPLTEPMATTSISASSAR